MINKICIIGVGLIGGSFAIGLKNSKKTQTIIGFDTNEKNLITAKNLGVIDNYSLDIKIALKDVSIILIATPVGSFTQILKLIKPHINDKTIISDVCSTKSSVIKAIKSVYGYIPKNFVPAHPIAGKEISGIHSIDKKLFNNKLVVITPVNGITNDYSIQIITELWQSLGANIEIMTDEKHDDLLAMTSHLPHMLAFGLMDYLICNDVKYLNYAAGGFKDFSRIAASNNIMWRDICSNNSKYIIKHIKAYQQSLDKLVNLIDNKKFDELEKIFKDAKKARNDYAHNLKNE